VSVVESRIDNLDIALAKSANMETRLSRVEVVSDLLEKRMDIRDGWAAGTKWAIGITLALTVPCAGYVIVSLLSKVFGFGVH
jgi:hypothetical protein